MYDVIILAGRATPAVSDQMDASKLVSIKDATSSETVEESEVKKYQV